MVLILLGAMTLLAPAIANGYPFLFFDTKIYGDIGKSTVTHILELVGPDAPLTGAGADAGAGPAGFEENTHDSMTYAGGRSPYFSAFIYLSDLVGPLWIVAVIQALVAAWVLLLTARSATPARTLRTYVVLVGGLTLASTLPFYAAFVMPDVWTGIAILATAVLAIWLERLSVWERLGLVAAAAFATATHGTNPPLVALTLILLALVVFFLRPNVGSLGRRAGWAVAPLVLAITAGALYTNVTAMVLGDKPRSPPFLMARVLADGPGRLYLQDACATGEPYELCRYKEKPFAHHNHILWSADLRVGVFQLADGDARRRLIDQERDFVRGTVAAYPVQQITASILNSLGQLVTFRTAEDFGRARQSWEDVDIASLMPTETAAATGALAYRGLFPFKVFDIFGYAAVLISLGFLGWRLTRADARAAYRAPAGDEDARSLAAFAGVSVALIMLLVANSIMCGTLSGVHDRYQARLIWLLPMLALLLRLRFGTQQAAARAESP